MGVLGRKLLRDLRGGLGSLLLITAIVAVGTGSYVGLSSAQRVLESSQTRYYREHHFADFWVDVKKAPLSVLPRVSAIGGIAQLEARVVFDVIVDVPREVRPVTGRLISLPADPHQRQLNNLRLVRGTGFSETRDEEVILSEAFAQAHDLAPGDALHLILNRRRERFLIVGTAITPEYVYMVRGPGDLLPDPRHFGILYVKERYARETLDFKDSFNQLTGRWAPAGSQDPDLQLERIEHLLDPFGVAAVTPRSRQASHRFLSDEIRGLGVTATIMPAIFLTVAALVLNVLMSRTAERQRSIIGTLKALGYANRQILLHFLSFGVVVGLAGGIAGNLLGMSMVLGMIEMYKQFFQFPTFVAEVYPDLLAAGAAISVAFATFGALRGAMRALRLNPAEAMRQRPPEQGGAVFVERWLPWLWRRLRFRTHLAVRSILRNRVRTATAVLATAISTAMVFTSLATYDAMNYLIEFQFERVTRSDVDLALREERSRSVVREVERLPGVDYAEASFGLPCDLRNGPYERRMGVIGLAGEHRLLTPRTADGAPLAIPGDGLVLSEALARLLHADVGDRLELTPARGRRETRVARVAAISRTFLGLECYASQRYLSELVGETLAVNTVHLQIDPARRWALYAEVKRLPNVQGMSVRADARANLERTFLETMTFSLGTIILFAGLIAFGSMLNASMIEVHDRTRDIATLRVLGYRPREVASIFIQQNVLIGLVGLVLGLPMGYALLVAAARGYETELFRMPVVARPWAVALTAAVGLVFVLITQWFVYRQVLALDWVDAAKVKE